MDVRCDRCGTEYEFDDALISERGTTVKCTNCGYQFRIFPASSVARAPERWVVRTQQGRELVFTSLRDLQKGIAQRQVGPTDLLSRGNQPARPLAAIAELEPFFRAGDQHPEPPAKQPRTIHGVAPPHSGPGATQPEISEVTRQVFPAEPATAPVVQHQHLPFAETTPVPAVPPRVHTVASFGAPAPPPAERMQSPAPGPLPVERFQSPAPGPLPVERFQSPAPGPLPVERFQSPAPGPLPVERFQSPAPGPLPVERFQSPAPGPLPRGAMQPASGSYPDSDARAMPAPVRHLEEPFQGYQDLQAELELEDRLRARRSRSRWIAGVLGAAALLLLAATFGRSFVQQRTAPAAAPAAAKQDLRVVNMLQKGEQHLAAGDFEAAKEESDKASALAERDPAVLLLRARLETARADVLWLKLKLVGGGDADKSAKSELARRVARARDATQRAERAAPKDQAVQALSVDALRLSDELDAARARAALLANDGVQPQDAVALALLALAEPGPPSSEAITHLKTAAKSEGEALRARTALVYALAGAGQRAEAVAELERLLQDYERHPLAAELQAFVQQAPAESADAAPEPVALAPSVPGGKARAPVGGRGGEALPGDFRVQLQQAGKALAANNLERAEKLYNAVLAKHPGNTEALSGLADVAHRRQDTATAERMYERVLKENPSYLPALMASADQKWAQGDRKGAITLYRRVLEQAEAGSSYGQRAAARIAQGEQAPAEAAPADAAAAPSAPAPSEPPAAEQPPAPAPPVDTTDLPGAQP